MSARTPGPGLAWAYALRKFGGGIKLVERLALPISNVTPTQVLLNDPDRVFWVVMNRSPYFGSISFYDVFTTATGLYLAGGGGYISMSVDEDGEAVTYPVWGISSVNAQNWYTFTLVKA